MPVEINEIIITAAINDAALQQNSKAITRPADNKAAADIIKTCIEEVLRILKEKEER